MLRELTRGKGGRWGEKTRREREVKVKNGGKENTEERRFRSSGAGPHTT